MSFKCDKCSYETNRRFNFERHVAKSHDDVVTPSFACSLCTVRETWRVNLLKHFQIVHNVELSTTTLLFENLESFSAWKHGFEKETASRFVKFKCGQKRIIFRCHREGVFKPRGVGKRRMRLLGTNKINGCCPAEIKVELDDDGSVKATVINTHVGHSKELSRVKLSLKSITSDLLNDSSEIVSLQDLNDWENSFNEKLKRFHLLTRRDLINITQSYELGNTATQWHKDYTSVEGWTRQQPEMIRFLKPEGTFLSSHPEFEIDDFILVVANDPQLDLLKRHGNTFLCVDSVHGRNKNDYYLTFLMVLDDLGQCFPCAILFSNKNDATTVKVFLSVIRSTVGFDLSPSVLMSDMSTVFRTAWRSVMREPAHEMFNAWDIEKLWKANLRKVAVRKQNEVFKILRNLLREKDEMTFSQSLDSTLSQLEEDPSTASFAHHFRNEYIGTVQNWARCHRSQSSVNNMFLEAMHKTINHIYFEGKKVQKQHRCLYALMKFIREKLYDRLTMNRGENSSDMILEIRQHHKMGLLMPEVEVEDTKEGWTLSLGSNTVPFRIVRNNLNCNCNLKCDDCEVCIHAFHCTCLDSVMKWTMCSHIHFLILKGIAMKHPLHRLTSGQNVSAVEEVQVIVDIANNEKEYENCIIESVIHNNEDFDPVFNDNGDCNEVKIDTTQVSHQTFDEVKQETMNIFQNIMDNVKTIQDLHVIQSLLIPVLNQENEPANTNFEVIHILENGH